ncbi:MAG: SecDF P1 head subdomain-containing protein [Solirubrobacteraceae bacterium]
MTSATRARVLALAAPGQLDFYDWEANALTPNGRTVAGQLTAQNPAALTISQGRDEGPGSAGGGGLSLYRAVTLAARAHGSATATSHVSRTGSQHYLFGAPGSAACAAVATASRGEHCLLAGPASSAASLRAELPGGVTVADGQQLTIPRGIVILQAANPSAATAIARESPRARFFVLTDIAALAGGQLTDPRASTDSSGSPDVEFGFTAAGNRAFSKLTAQIVHRAAISSPGTTQQNQHFAIALDGQLISVPSIDYRIYPDGIRGGGADITGGFTRVTARDLSVLLRSGPLSSRLVAH